MEYNRLPEESSSEITRNLLSQIEDVPEISEVSIVKDARLETAGNESNASLRFMSAASLFSYKRYKCVALMNCLSYLILLITMIVCASVKGIRSQMDFSDYFIVVGITKYVFFVNFGMVILSTGLFALFTVCYNRQGFNTLVLEKVGYSYILTCLLNILVFCSIINDICIHYYISAALLIGLKIFVHLKIYIKIKYHDDGHEFVSRIEFVCMHIPFSFLHAWLSYCIIFTIFLSVLYSSEMNSLIAGFAITSFVLVAAEAALYVTYYKDVFYALMIILSYAGVYLYHDDSPQNGPIEYTALGLLIALSVFVLITLIHNCESVFYMKHDQYMRNLLRRRNSESNIQSKPEKERASRPNINVMLLSKPLPLRRSSLLNLTKRNTTRICRRTRSVDIFQRAQAAS